MTTWDLFRLLRGNARWGWQDEAVCNLLYCTCRNPPYPAHYSPIGTAVKYWPKMEVVSVEVTGTGPLKIGDRVGFLLLHGFFEEDVISLQVDNKPVQKAALGQRVGHKTKLRKSELPPGTQVFRVHA
jgi:hypothetical protein